MIRTITHFKKHRYLYLAIATTFVMVLYATFVLGHVSSCFTLDAGSNSLGLSFSYTESMVQKFFESRTQEQLLCYGTFLQIWDPIFAFISTLMLVSWIMFIFKEKRLFLIIPILTMIADWSENFIELLMLKRYLSLSPMSEILVSVGSGINSLKWIFLTLTYLLILFGILIAVKKVITKSKSQ